MSTWLHGTTPDRADAILAEGVDTDAEKHSDPGDFGWGFYLTGSACRALCYGTTVLTVEIDETRFAHIPNPYFLDGLSRVGPTTEVERLFCSVAFDGNRMRTVQCRSPEERVAACKAVRQAFLDAGYAGISTPHEGGEAVVFDASAIVSLTR